MLATQILAEVVGTTIFLLAIVSLIFRPSTDPVATSGAVPIYIALGLAVSIFVASGLGGFGHLNPVVSAVCAANGSVSVMDAITLMAAQFTGGCIAYATWKSMTRKDSSSPTV
jgi:glycerol uptake facilitator-like aquaporin